jgi:hypothetical protein
MATESCPGFISDPTDRHDTTYFYYVPCGTTPPKTWARLGPGRPVVYLVRCFWSGCGLFKECTRLAWPGRRLKSTLVSWLLTDPASDGVRLFNWQARTSVSLFALQSLPTKGLEVGYSTFKSFMHGKITYANFMNLGVGGTHRRNVLFCANGPKQKRIQYIVRVNC